MKLRSINTHFWDDPYISDLSAIEKLLFLYLFTNQFVELCGIYEIALKRIAFDCNLEKSEVESIIEKFSNDGKIHRHGNWIVLVNFIKNQSMNPNMKDACNNQFKVLPSEIKALPYVVEITEINDFLEPLPNPYPSLTQPLPNGGGKIEDRRKKIEERIENIEEEEIKRKKESTTYSLKKEKKDESVPDSASEVIIEIVHPLQIWVRDELTNVSKLKKQLTLEQCEKLLVNHKKTQIRDVLRQMNNYKPLATKNLSVYDTCLNWLNRREKDDSKNGNYNGQSYRLNQFERGEVNVDAVIENSSYFTE